MEVKKHTVRFRTVFGVCTYIGEANIEYTKGTGLTDEYGYTDGDEICAELLEVWNEDVGTVVKPKFLFAAENGPFRATMELAAFDEFYNPTSSDKSFPGEGNQPTE
jgi:hypothetical protein